MSKYNYSEFTEDILPRSHAEWVIFRHSTRPQRVVGPASHAHIHAGDPVLALLSGRTPGEGADLSSQPTLSRFKNAVTAAELLNLAETLTEMIIERERQAAQTKRFRGAVRADLATWASEIV